MSRKLLVLTLAALALLPASASAATMGSTVQLAVDRGAPTINTWGFDVKQPSALADFNGAGDLPTQVFGGSFGMNLIRIPIRADIPTTVKGNLNAYYVPVVQAVRAAQAAGTKGGHAVRVYASKLSVTCDNGGYSENLCKAKCTATRNCPDYSESIAPKDGAVNTKVYGNFLANYVEAMRKNGVRVDIIGPQNEPASNPRSNLNGPRMNQVIGAMVDRLGKDGHAGYRPRVSADDAAHPDTAFVRGNSAAQWNAIDYASTHFNSEKLDCEVPELRSFAAAVRAKGRNVPIWNTELHYTTLSNNSGDDSPCPGGVSFTRADDFFSAKLALIAAFQNFDSGVSGVVWWSYKPRGWGATHPEIAARSQIQNALVDSTFYGRRLVTDDQGGGNLKLATPALASRGFLSGNGKTVSVWIVNDQAGAPFEERIVLPAGKVATAAPTSAQWLGMDTALAPAKAAAASIGDGGAVRVTLPPESITLLRIPVK